MLNRIFILIWLFLLNACGAGMTVSGAVDSSGSSGNSLDGEISGEVSGAPADPVTPLQAPVAGAADPGPDTNLAYYYLPTKGPRMAAGPGLSGPLGAPVDDDQVHASCYRTIALSDGKYPNQPLDPHDEVNWTLREGKDLKRKLLVSRKGDAVAEDAQIRVYYARPASGALYFKDFLLPQLDTKGREIEIAMEAPEFGDEIKILYLPANTATDPQDLLSRKCAAYKFDGVHAAWTSGSYESYAQTLKDRIFTNQIGHFLIKIRPNLLPEHPGINLPTK